MTVCPCRAMRWKMPFSVWRSAYRQVGLADTPARRHDLRAVIAGDPVEQVEGLGVVAVGCLVDDKGGGGGVDGGQFGIERGLAVLPLGRAARPPVDRHVADGVRQPVTGLEGGEVAGGVLLELHDGDGLPDTGAALPQHLVEAEDRRKLGRGVGAPEGRALGGGTSLGRADVGDGGGGLARRARRRRLRLGRLRRGACSRRPRPRGPGGARAPGRAGVGLLDHGVLLDQAVETDHAGHHAFEGGGHLRRNRVDDGPGRIARRLHRLQRCAQRSGDHRCRAADRE